jgi:6-phosphogluconolactonase/glucosamine-6-phosphate isomerase/deaminase
MTLTFPALLDSQKIIFLIRGAKKERRLSLWLNEKGNTESLPAMGIIGHSDIDIFYDSSE